MCKQVYPRDNEEASAHEGYDADQPGGKMFFSMGGKKRQPPVPDEDRGENSHRPALQPGGSRQVMGDHETWQADDCPPEKKLRIGNTHHDAAKKGMAVMQGAVTG